MLIIITSDDNKDSKLHTLADKAKNQILNRAELLTYH